ncbi:MAG: hypothetical protein ACOYWZ_04455 [Bacillota bacterium]
MKDLYLEKAKNVRKILADFIERNKKNICTITIEEWSFSDEVKIVLYFKNLTFDKTELSKGIKENWEKILGDKGIYDIGLVDE